MWEPIASSMAIVARGLASHLRLKLRKGFIMKGEHLGRQGPGISSEIETSSCYCFPYQSPRVARGLASHLRLKLV